MNEENEFFFNPHAILNTFFTYSSFHVCWELKPPRHRDLKIYFTCLWNGKDGRTLRYDRAQDWPLTGTIENYDRGTEGNVSADIFWGG